MCRVFRKIGVAGAAAVGLCGWVGYLAALSAGETPVTVERLLDGTNAPLHQVIIRGHEGPRKIATGRTNFQGQPVTASCSSCHATTRPNIETRSAADLRQFH